MKKKKFLVSILIFKLFSTPLPSFAARTYMDHGITCTESYFPTKDFHHPSQTMNEPVTVHVNGRYLITDVAPTIINGRTFLPLRATGEAMNVTIHWNQLTQTVTANKNNTTVSFTLGKNVYLINGQAHTADAAPILLNNRLLLPLRIFSEALDAKVHWNQYLYDISINTDAIESTPPPIPSNTLADSKKIIRKYYIPSSLSDPYVGSWRYNSNSYNTFTENYLFISKTVDSYHCITASITKSPYMNINAITIHEDKGFIDYNASRFKIHTTACPLYYRGGPTGFEIGFTSLFQITNNNQLQQTSLVYEDGIIFADPSKPIYNKF